MRLPTEYEAVVGAMVILAFTAGLMIGPVATSSAEATPQEDPSVTCTTYVDEDGEAAGMCFVSGDVEFEWLDNSTSRSGTVSLDGLPPENSTVHKEASA